MIRLVQNGRRVRFMDATTVWSEMPSGERASRGQRARWEGGRFRMIVNAVDVVPTDAPLPKLPVARALWVPRPSLKVGAEAWIRAGGAHHTSFSYSVNAQHLQDFAGMAGIEFLLIDENTRMAEFKDKLRWNDLYYTLSKGL